MTKEVKKVVIEVRGGIADVTQCSDDVELEIIDHDIVDEDYPSEVEE